MLKYVKRNGLQREDEVDMDRRRQVEKDKMTVQECTYPSTVTANVVTRRDNDESSGKKRSSGIVVT
jgi:hypothetical protein